MYFNKWITGVQHVAVPTNDLEKTIEFYHSLGFTTALETYNEAAKHRAVFLQLGNLIIESYENGCAVGHYLYKSCCNKIRQPPNCPYQFTFVELRIIYP